LVLVALDQLQPLTKALTATILYSAPLLLLAAVEAALAMEVVELKTALMAALVAAAEA
jgi:hypothetical protein